MSKVWKMTLGASIAALLAGCSSTQSSSSYDSGFSSSTSNGYASINKTLDNATGQAEIVAVAMHADWCGTCKTLGPKVVQARSAFSAEQIDLRVADLTDLKNPAGRATLESLGLNNLYSMNQGATGVVYLIDAQTGEVLSQIRGDDSVIEIQDEMSNALMKAGAFASVDTDNL